MAGLLFYDFEVTKWDWLVVLIDMELQKETVIINDRQGLVEYYEAHKEYIWIGFNSNHYDQYILKGIILDMNPKKINDFIIVQHNDGWEYSNLFRKVPLLSYDVMASLGQNARGLKCYEGFMGNDIRESSIPFDIPRKLTEEEIQEMVHYCRHDVEQTIEVFINTKSEFDAVISLIKMFSLPLASISKTKVQIAATILEARRQKYNDEFDISFPDTLRVRKYKHVIDFYADQRNRHYSKALHTKIAGVPHDFGWGGVHGAIEHYYGEGLYIMADVASLYPSLMIRYGLLSRSCKPEKFKSIVEQRLKYKAEKNPLQAPLKIVINGTYGAGKDKHNPLYDPLMANNVCIYGQLLILDLIEHLEPYVELIQSNTDGILIKMPQGYDEDDWYSLVDEVCIEWEDRTGLKLEFDEYRKVFQKDVNNYVIVDADGHIKSKGLYVKKLSRLDYDLAIVNRAIVDFMVKGRSVRDTVMGCNDMRDFQMVKKISSKYVAIYKNVFYRHPLSKRTGKMLKSKTYMDNIAMQKLNEKCVRIFASKDKSKGTLVKLHAETGCYEKIENAPEHAFIYNESVDGVPCVDELDKEWYIELATKRLKGFGYI